MNTGKFYKHYVELAKDFPPNLPRKLALDLTTIRNFNTKTSSAPMPIP